MSGEEGTLAQTDLLTLCGDLTSSERSAGSLLRELAALLPAVQSPATTTESNEEREGHEHGRRLLLEAQAAVMQSDDALKQIEAAVSRVFPQCHNYFASNGVGVVRFLAH